MDFEATTKHIAFLLLLPSLLFFNYRGEAQPKGMPRLLLVEKGYWFLAATALFAIVLNYRGEAQRIGINLKRPL